tara:strand:- start:7579 stop:7995 length:417 start_codon:yes stop_codon:yes gene_type:complete
MKQYSFLDTLLLVNGIPMSGFDEGDDVINLARLSDSASHKIGVDGEMTISISSDRSGAVTFSLMQTSDSNAILSGLVTGMENGAFVPIFIQFKDVRGGDLGSGTQGYIRKPADMGRGQVAGSQEWTVITERLDLLHGG